ncbi:MAG TPA: hypothetical protein PK992_18390 [Planctomycetaceae bacterium]|nr:hypothetical protein [Planctomycetaceae bacterium]
MIGTWIRRLTDSLGLGSLKAERLIASFDRDRDRHQREYFQRAASTGRPRGLRWIGCEWLSHRVILLDRTTQQPNLLVSINLRFEAVEGGDMEDVAAVANVRDACAVFQWTANAWQTSGRTLFNMNPDEARERLAGSYEPM